MLGTRRVLPEQYPARAIVFLWSQRTGSATTAVTDPVVSGALPHLTKPSSFTASASLTSSDTEVWMKCRANAEIGRSCTIFQSPF